MNFREHFETWHQAKYRYICPGSGTALNWVYANNLVQARWEAWQACASWHPRQSLEQQQREWVGLTDDEIADAYKDASKAINYCAPSHVDIARAIEARLKAKNA